MKDNGYHTATEQKPPQDRAYPSVDQVLSERYPNYGAVFCEFHCKSLPFTSTPRGGIDPTEANKVATRILDDMEE